MAKEEIEERIKSIICEYVDVDRDSITPEMSFTYDIGIDSFGLVTLICSIEESFNVQIPEYELTSFQTMNDMINYIHAHKAS